MLSTQQGSITEISPVWALFKLPTVSHYIMAYLDKSYCLNSTGASIACLIAKNAVDDLAASANRILEITQSSNAEDFSIKEKAQMTRYDVSGLCDTLTRNPRIRNDHKRTQILQRSFSWKRSVSRLRETDNLDWCWCHNQYWKPSRNCRKSCNAPDSKSTDMKNVSVIFPADTR